MEEIVISVHHEPCPDRIKQLYYAGKVEYESCDEAAEAPHFPYYVLHSLIWLCLCDGFVHHCLDLCKNFARRHHHSIFVRAVDAYELRVKLALSAVDGAYSLLKFDICFVDILCTLEVVSVCSASLAL